MSIHIMRPDKEQMSVAGYGRLSHVPFFMNGEWEYQQVASSYLLDRAAGIERDDEFGQSHRRPTPISMEGFAAALANFLDWTEYRGTDWRTVEFINDVIDGYQADMAAGTWSLGGKALAPATINSRVGEAVNFLQWAARKGHREAFKVAMQSVHSWSRKDELGQRTHIATEARSGRLRQSPAVLRMPTDEEVRKWQTSVRVRKGKTKALMCDLILCTGIRRAECAEWRIHTLPLERREWNVVGEKVLVKIEFGTKGGPKFETPDGVKGPARVIELPLQIAERLDEYRTLVRPRLRSKYVRGKDGGEGRSNRRREREDRLFLSEFDGRPISKKCLYEAWIDVPNLPFEGFSPHCGRHWFACKSILDWVERERAAVADAKSTIRTLSWVRGAAGDAILLKLKPQLGHIDTRTTEAYLRWICAIYDKGTLDALYNAELESFQSAEEG